MSTQSHTSTSCNGCTQRQLQSTWRSAADTIVLCELLEPRLLLSGTSYIVDSLADVVAADGMITLREAIEAANTNAAVFDAPAGMGDQVDVITFAPGLAGGTITLGGTELEITDSIDIRGPGAEALTIDADRASRAFGIYAADEQVLLTGLTVTRGLKHTPGVGEVDTGFGGGIRQIGGQLTLDDVVVSRCGAVVGGGIWTSGATTIISDTIIRMNSSAAIGGALAQVAAI